MSREEINQKFKEEMVTVYGNLLKFVDVEFGDIDPPQADKIEELEISLMDAVTDWLISRRS